MKDTKIEWADNTINFYIGCTKISAGCKNCYMFRLENRFGRNPGVIRKTNWQTIERNLKNWEPSKVFVNSMSDTFHESLNIDDVRDMFELMEKYPQHQYLILTKRIQRAVNYQNHYKFKNNFWIGTSIESQQHMTRLIDLSKIKSKVRFVSFEPLLNPITLAGREDNFIDWAIVGGESGYNPRLPERIAFVQLIYQLHIRKIPVFFKQWGGSKKCKCHGTYGCRLINDKTLDEMPI